MTTPSSLLALGAALFCVATTACDSDTASPAEYRIVAHADVASLVAAPWIADAMKRDKIDLKGDLGPCADLVTAATGVTLGANDDAFELYVEGKFTGKQAKACTDHLQAELAKKKSSKPEEKIDTAQLGDGLFAVYRGAFKPSRARLAALGAADPSPSGKHPLWLVAHDDANKGEVEHVEAWASAAKGLDAHVEVHFDSAKSAAEIYGQATLGLTAMRFSDDTSELAKAIKLSSGGDTLTAEFTASHELLRKLVEKGHVGGKVENHTGDDSKASVSIELDAG